MEAILPMMMDVMVIALLAATIFYAMRLSRQLKLFRDSRKGIEVLMKDLSGQIDRAERAVAGLHENVKNSGRDLQDKINDAKALTDELQLMTETGDSLAKRLEGVSDRSRSGRRFKPQPRQHIEAEDVAPAPKKASPFPFSIRDPEFESGNDQSGNVDEAGFMAGDYEEEAEEMSGLSRAEQELYAALKQRKENAGGF